MFRPILLSAALLVASTAPGFAVPWCNDGTKHVGPTQPITLSGAQLLTLDAATPSVPGASDTVRASTLATNYCAQTYGGPPKRPAPSGASGESRLAPFGITAPANFNTPGYSMGQGMTFQCETCDYPFLPRLDGDLAGELEADDLLDLEVAIVTDIVLPDIADEPVVATGSGMTWAIQEGLHPVTGAVTVSCKTGAMDCNPYNGDTACAASVPTLCINKLGLPKPVSVTEGRWNKWTGAVIATTAPGPAASTLSAANAECVAEFGEGWRVAQFHDALNGRSAWSFSAYGNAGTMADRFRVDIDDQPGGVCWNRSQ